MDKYLKVSRLIKRRTLAKEAAEAERIEANGRVVKPSYTTKPGDLLTLHYGNRVLTIEVLSVENRPGKTAATEMYRVVEESYIPR